MQNRKESSYNFYFYFLLSIIIIILSSFGYLNFLRLPFEKGAAFIFSKSESNSLSKLEKLEKENKELLKNISEKKVLEQEMNALKDQFQTTSPKSINLLPAKVVGAPKFLPGENYPLNFIVNKGLNDGVKVGMAVVYQNNLVGKILKTSSFLSEVDLLSNEDFSLTSKVLNLENNKNVLGVVKTTGNQITFENVLLSEKIKQNDMVMTSGDVDVSGAGIPPDLIIGKITSVEKKESALFQKASVKSLLDFTKLSTVFIVVGIK